VEGIRFDRRDRLEFVVTVSCCHFTPFLIICIKNSIKDILVQFLFLIWQKSAMLYVIFLNTVVKNVNPFTCMVSMHNITLWRLFTNAIGKYLKKMFDTFLTFLPIYFRI
jgi:hypothetical protein